MNKILVVDDEKIIQKATKNILSKYGECQIASNGAEAISFYDDSLKEKSPFDLIVLDVSLGDKNGLEVLQEIRKKEKDQDIEKKQQVKVLMATGNREKKIVKDCIAAGCSGYLLKPLKPDNVLPRLIEYGLVKKEETA